MKIFFILFCLEFFAKAMSLQHTGFSQVHSKGGKRHKLLHHTKKFRSKFHRRLHKQTKATFLPTSEGEQNAVLENMSPEYKYEDSKENSDQSDPKISNLLDDKTIEELASKNLLDGEGSQSTRGLPALGLAQGVRAKPSEESLEKMNIRLQNTLPEYQYDRAERGPGFSYDSCVDLDPDCWKYEMHGLCSDSPDLAEKRFNCKKTCHLCISSTGTRRRTKAGS